MHSRTQAVFAWSGPFAVALFFIGLVIAQFFPPPSPSLDAETVAALYRENTTAIRIGMVFFLISGVFTAPFVALISLNIRRIEGSRTPLIAYAQLAAGSAGIVFFVLPAILFLLTAYRPERSLEMTQTLNDLSWFVTIIAYPCNWMQCILTGLAIFSDKRAQPLFPRWLGYFNFWVALLFLPGSLLAFVYSGPFAWNGLFAFWIPGAAFGGWYIAMTLMMLKAIKRQDVEPA